MLVRPGGSEYDFAVFGHIIIAPYQFAEIIVIMEQLDLAPQRLLFIFDIGQAFFNLGFLVVHLMQSGVLGLKHIDHGGGHQSEKNEKGDHATNQPFAPLTPPFFIDFP